MSRTVGVNIKLLTNSTTAPATTTF